MEWDNCCSGSIFDGFINPKGPLFMLITSWIQKSMPQGIYHRLDFSPALITARLMLPSYFPGPLGNSHNDNLGFLFGAVLCTSLGGIGTDQGKGDVLAATGKSK